MFVPIHHIDGVCKVDTGYPDVAVDKQEQIHNTPVDGLYPNKAKHSIIGAQQKHPPHHAVVPLGAQKATHVEVLHAIT